MKKSILLFFSLMVIGMITYSCQKENLQAENEIPQKVIDQLTQMGFNPDGIEEVDEGYRIERDIVITDEFLATAGEELRVPNAEQYSTNNLVSTGGNRNITIYAPVGGRKGYSTAMIAGLDEAIARYNGENLEITFSRTTDRRSGDINMTRLSKRDENRGVLGSAGFPTASGDPYGEIKMSGVLESRYGLSVNEIASIIKHEIGHCIGFRHTDYFDRSISCGSGGNEGAGSIGANHIPGTPTGADLGGPNGSFMLSCFNGSDRPFTNADKTALDFLY